MQTELPLALPDINPELSAFLKESYSLEEAQRLTHMSRTGFFRFRSDHGIGKAAGKVNGAEIVRGLERVRGLTGQGPFPPLREYATKLMTRVEVCLHFGFKVTSLYKLRVRHRVPLLPGGIYHCDDIIAALEAEQRGERRLASPGSIRVMTRSRKPRKAPKPVSAPSSPAA